MTHGLDAAALAAHLDDPMWRLCNLYKIIVKGDGDDDDGLVIQFQPNRAQRRLLARLHTRNIILKARQLGFTTLIAILWLDTALFAKSPIRCGMIAQDRQTAEAIFRDKVKFAYDNLDPALRERMPLRSETKSELLWDHNGSSIRVATSVRGGTIHRLHVSEFGKIAAKFPDKAREVVTGSLPAVPKTGVAVIESTAEGQDGPFYDMTMRAKALHDQGSKLTPKDYRFHFFPWWEEPNYTIDPDGVTLSETDQTYFLEVEGRIKRVLTEGQKAWYVTTMRSDFAGEAPLMWQEYPTYPDEAFKVSTDGCYYASQLAIARKQGRVRPSLPVESVPVNTFWDIGRGDMTCIWLHQRVGPENRFIGYYEASGEDFIHYTTYLQGLGYVFGRHYLPHEADHKRMGETPDTNRSLKEMLENLMPGQRFDVVPRVTNLTAGIQATRAMFATCWFDEAKCEQGLKRLGNYRKKWDKTRGCWSDQHNHDENSHGCLTGETLVLSDRGEVAIRDVVVGDRVWTPAGYAKVLNSGPTKIASELIEITTLDGATIVATPEHKFFTTRGVVTADTLRDNDSIFHRRSYPCLTSQSIESMGYRDAVIESFKASVTGTGQQGVCTRARPEGGRDFCTSRFTQHFMASRQDVGKSDLLTAISAISALITGFAFGLRESASTAFKSLMDSGSTGSQRATTKRTTPKTEESQCTATFGKSTMALFQTAFMCITKTATSRTTTLPIWSFCRHPYTRSTTDAPTPGLEAKPTRGKFERPASLPSSGIQAMPAASGTQKMAFELGRIESGTQLTAYSAGSSSILHTQQEPNTAIQIAKLRRFTPEQETLVYDLTVDKHHCYLANGMLVSNSDAFRQFGQAADSGEVFVTAIAAPRAPGAGAFKRKGSPWAV